MTLYDYIFYRICRWKRPNKNWRIEPVSQSGRWVPLLISLNLSTVCYAAYYCFRLLSGLHFPTVIFAMIVATGLFVTLFFHIYRRRYNSRKSKERWQSLCARWADEPVRVRLLRGWAIVLFYLLSIVAWMAAMVLAIAPPIKLY